MQSRAELLGGLDGKANKSELVALASRLDAWMSQKSQKARDRQREPIAKDRERSFSPRSEQESTRDTWASTSLRHVSAPPGKVVMATTSPNISEKIEKKKA